jgi:hypothetical protein
MAVDVIIDPSSGQIYWNDAAGSGTQTIAISGNATNAINIVGYSNFFNAGGGGLGTQILATFTDSPTSTFTPGTNAYDLGSTSLRWNFYGTGGNFTGAISTSSTTASTSSATGALIVSGGAGIAKTSYFGESVVIQGSTASTTPTTGALVVTGGVGISGSLNVGSSSAANVFIHNTDYTSSANLYLRTGTGASLKETSIVRNSTELQINSVFGTITNYANVFQFYATNLDDYLLKISSTGATFYTTTASTSTITGALVSAGGVGIAKTSYFGQSIVIQGTTASGSTTTGALVVTGGVGIGGSLNVFGTIDVANNIEVLSQKEVRFFNSANTFYTGLKAGSSLANVTFTLPITDGTSGQLLYTNGSGGLGWTTVAGGGVSGIISLNGLTASTQTFATGTSGTDFNISSTTSTHTFNIPYAASGATGLVTTQTQTLAGSKTFTSQTIISDTTASTTTATGSLLVFGGLGVTGQINAASLQTTGNAVISGNLTFNGVGVFGNATSDTINSLARYISDILPSTDNSYDLGNNSLGWRNFKVSGVGTIATLQVTSVTSGLWAGTAITLAYGGTNNNLSGIGNSYRVAIYNDSGTAITNISSAGTANSVLFQSSQSVSPIWAGQSQLVVGGATTAAQWQTSRTVTFATGDVTGSFSINGSADVSNVALTIAANSVALGTDTTGNYAQSVAVSGSGITLGGTAGEGTDFTIYSSGTSANTVSTLVLRDGSGNFSAGTITASLTGTASIATSSVNSATTTDTTSTLYLLGSRSSTGFAGTALYVDSSISILGSQITAGVWGGTAISAVNGGTGQNTYTIGDILYASSTTALSKLSAGTAASVLTSNGAGTAPSWKAAASGGSPAGSSSWLQYNNSGAFGATSHLAYNGNINNDFVISAPYSGATQGQVNIGLGITGFDGVTLGKFAGSASGTVIAANQASGFTGNFADFQLAGSSKFTIGFDGKITVVGVYSLPTTAGTAGSVLTSNGTGNQFYWSAPGAAGGGSGTVTSGTAGSVAFYTGTGTTVGGAPGFTYTTSGTASTINVFGGGAIGTTIFTVQATSSTSVRVGIGTNLPQYELEIVGELSATNKSFVIDHPTKPGKKLRYGSLEGPENGVYVRGELKGSNIIETPDHWIGLVYPDSFTVTLTPISRFSHLYIEKIEDYKVFIADDCMNPIHCYYTVWAERKDIPKLITEY